MNLEKRNIIVAVILSIITFGLYGLYWQIKITDEAHELSESETTASGGMAVLFTICTFGLYFFYWVYKITKELNDAKAIREMDYDESAPTFYLILTLVGFGIVSIILMQLSINDIIEEEFGDDE